MSPKKFGELQTYQCSYFCHFRKRGDLNLQRIRPGNATSPSDSGSLQAIADSCARMMLRRFSSVVVLKLLLGFLSLLVPLWSESELLSFLWCWAMPLLTFPAKSHSLLTTHFLLIHVVPRQFLPRLHMKTGNKHRRIEDLNIKQWPLLTTKHAGIIVGGHAQYFTNRMFNALIIVRSTGKIWPREYVSLRT